MQLNYGGAVFEALSDLARRYQFRNRDEVCCYGITVSQCYALQVLSRQKTVTATELALHLGLDLSSTTRVVDQLVKKKLAMRRRGLQDARVREIQITDAGTRMVSRVEEDFAKVMSEALADFPPAVQAAVPDVLRQLTAVLNVCGTKTNFIPAGTIRRVSS
jgi:MarR family transcriptional regulator, 2-MHQ and catechol-resistance regulon repressor